MRTRTLVFLLVLAVIGGVGVAMWRGVGPLPDPEGCATRVAGTRVHLTPEQARNAAVIGAVAALLRRGEAEGAFRAGVDPLDLHMLISGFCFYRVSNRHTLRAIFGEDPAAPGRAEAHRRMVVEAVLRFLRPA